MRARCSSSVSRAGSCSTRWCARTGCTHSIPRALPRGRRISPAGLGTFRTDTQTFVVFVIAFVITFALLNFLAALFIGPLDQSVTGHLY
jgi:hypothetical protein